MQFLRAIQFWHQLSCKPELEQTRFPGFAELGHSLDKSSLQKNNIVAV